MVAFKHYKLRTRKWLLRSQSQSLNDANHCQQSKQINNAYIT